MEMVTPLRVSGTSWLGDKEIAEDRRLCNAMVVAKIISHDDDCSQMIVALNFLPGSVRLRNMASFCLVPRADARHVVRCIISWSKAEDRRASNILLKYWAA